MKTTSLIILSIAIAMTVTAGEDELLIKQVLQELREIRQVLPREQISHIPELELDSLVFPPNLWIDKPKYQSIEVIQSTSPDIPKGTIFHSNSHGRQFYFKGYYLKGKVLAEKSPIDETFGDQKQVFTCLWSITNPFRFRRVETSDKISRPLLSIPSDYSVVSSNTVFSIRFPIDNPMPTPLLLTNKFYSIEFGAPKPIPPPEEEKK